LRHSDALQLSIPAQGLANGDAALPHAAYPGIQPYPGVGEYNIRELFILLPPFTPKKYSKTRCVHDFVVKLPNRKKNSNFDYILWLAWRQASYYHFVCFAVKVI
jgi:hypothetical protein